jgi:heme/copper-type cytochrome/quinol oxidase subunit 4
MSQMSSETNRGRSPNMRVVDPGEPELDQKRMLTSWFVAGIVGFVAFIGMLALVAALVFAAGSLPQWANLALGASLAVVVALFAWLVFLALRRSEGGARQRRRGRAPRRG